VSTVTSLVSDQLSVSLSTSCSDCNPSSRFVNGHVDYVTHGLLLSAFTEADRDLHNIFCYVFWYQQVLIDWTDRRIGGLTA